MGFSQATWFDTLIEFYSYYYNHKNYNFLGCDWSKKLLFSTNSLAKLLLDSKEIHTVDCNYKYKICIKYCFIECNYTLSK